MEKMPIFALSSNSCERSTDERLSTPVGFFYAPVRPICGSATPCRSRNARRLTRSSTAGSAEPLFVFSTQPVIVINLCRILVTTAGRRAKCAPPAACSHVWETEKDHFHFATLQDFRIFAVSSYYYKRTDVRLFSQIGIFYALSQPICGPVTPCRSGNARRLVVSWTTGSAGPFFYFRTSTSNCL